MKLTFSKYHGTGNDFILIDNREASIHLSIGDIVHLCDRHFGIGADGLIFLISETGYDFGMKYYNSDGKESTMCGNGGRCITAFANSLGILDKHATFLAIDGDHTAEVLNEEGNITLVKLRMSDVSPDAYRIPNFEFQIDTGSPHLVLFKDHVREIDVVMEGRKLRYDSQYAPDGINVDFVEKMDNGLFVRTYERGVEDETLSCGTGVTAAALAVGSSQFAGGNHVIARNKVTKQTPQASNIKIETLGGQLAVSFQFENGAFTNIWLEGPAEFVFSGEMEM